MVICYTVSLPSDDAVARDLEVPEEGIDNRMGSAGSAGKMGWSLEHVDLIARRRRRDMAHRASEAASSWMKCVGIQVYLGLCDQTQVKMEVR